MFLRKDATKHLVIRVDELKRKTTIYAKIALIKKGRLQGGDYLLPFESALLLFLLKEIHKGMENFDALVG